MNFRSRGSAYPAKVNLTMPDAKTATTWSTIRYLCTVPTAWRMILGGVLSFLAVAGWSAWLPMFFMRVHGLSLSEMSASFGAFMGGSAMLSMVLSGFLSDRLAKKGERWRVSFVGAALLAGIPFAVAAPLVSNVWLAWGLVVCFQLTTSGGPPVVAAAGVAVVTPRARGMFISLKNFALYAIGGACGPILIGFLSDQMTAQLGDLALRYSLLVVPVMLVPAALSFFWAGSTAAEDTRRIADRL
jgi:MFS family permease